MQRCKPAWQAGLSLKVKICGEKSMAEKKNGPWTIQETKRKYTNAFMEVCEDQVLQPDGQPGSYATVTMSPGVAVLPVDEEKVAYLVQQFRYALGVDSLEVVSGTIEEGEEPLPAARREAREELGIEAGEWLDMGVVNLDTSVVRSPVHLFLARNLTFTRTEREGTEMIKGVRLPLAEAAEQVMSSTISHGPSMILILKAKAIYERNAAAGEHL